MSSRRQPPPFELAFGRSPRLLALLAALHALALVAVAACALPMTVRAVLAGGVLASFGWQVRRYRRPRYRAIAADAGGGWVLVRCADGGREPVTPVSAYVHPWLVIVRYLHGRDGWWPRAVLIAADATAPEPLRRLRVRLRMQSATDA